MRRVDRPSRADWLIAAVALGLTLVLRVPFRSELPFHWDAAQFALAIADYNIAHSQPHAPGYFLYVKLGWLLNCVVHDPHASLVWLSVIAGSLLVPVMYWFGLVMFDRRTGIVAALLALTSPALWLHSEVALTYVVDALLVTVTMLVCWRALQRGGAWSDAVLIGVLLAGVGGVRQQTVIALGPVLLYCFWRFGRCRFGKFAVALVVALAFGLIWIIPMICAAGGLNLYLEIVCRHARFNAPATRAGGGFRALGWNSYLATVFSLSGLLLAALVLPRALKLRSAAQRLLMIWVGSMLLFGTAVSFIKQPGYVLNFLPALLLLTAAALAQLRWHVFAIIATGNLVAFLAWPKAWDRPASGMVRTAREIRERDSNLRVTVAGIRRQCVAAETLVCHSHEYLDFGLRQFQLLLPDYDQIQFDPDTTIITPPERPLMGIHQGKLQFVSGPDWTRKRTVILIVPPGDLPQIFATYLNVEHAQPLLGAHAWILPTPK